MIQPRSGKVTFTHKIRVFGSTLGETSIYTKKKKNARTMIHDKDFVC